MASDLHTSLRVLNIIAALGLSMCSNAMAQQILQTRFHLSFQEVDAATGEPVLRPSGQLNPGQAAMISLSVSFEPPVGTLLTDPVLEPGTVLPPGEWRVHALANVESVFVRTWQSPANGAWQDLRLAPGWNGHVGNPGPYGVSFIRASQSAEPFDQRNPVEGLWQGRWTPDDYSERTVRFQADHGLVSNPITGLVLYDHGQGTYTWVQAWSLAGDVHIPVVPWDPPCYANCDGSTTEPKLTVDDFTCYINEFAAALILPYEQQVEHYANCDGSTTVPVLTVDDFTCFINAFAAGCR